MSSKKNVMRAFKISHISAVDTPAQEGATATIMKRAPISKHEGEPRVPTKQETPATKSADETANQKELDSLKAQVAKSNQIIALNAEEREVFDGLQSDAAKDVFLSKSSEERKADIAKAAERKKVVYKSADGSEYTAEDDPRLVLMAKSRDEDRKALKAAEDRAIDAELTKRAEALPHLPGTVEDTKAMLKAIDAIEDKESRDRSIQALEAQNTALGAAFKSVGHVSNTPAADSAEGQLTNMAKAYAKDNNVSEAQAYTAVLETPEGSALYAQSLN